MRCPSESHDGPERLLAFNSQRLEADRALEAHVRECASCSALVAEQRAVSDALDLWEAPPVTVDFDRRLYERIARETSWWDFLVRPFRPALGPRWVPVAAAAGVLIAVGLWMSRPAVAPVPPLPPDQAAAALQEMQVMQDFSNLIRSDAEPRM